MEQIQSTFTVPCEKSNMASFASPVMKNIIVLLFKFSPRFRFPVKLICFIGFQSASRACWLLKSTCYHFIVILKLILV